MKTPSSHMANSMPEAGLIERRIQGVEAIKSSNNDVITAIYGAVNETTPKDLVAETNESGLYANYAGAIRLVYDNEREDLEYGGTEKVNPVVDKLSDLVTSGLITCDKVGVIWDLQPKDDPFYDIIDKSFGVAYQFTDAKTSQPVCFAIKTDAYNGAHTILVSPEHVEIDTQELA